MSTLQKVQSELKAPKGQFNSFGKYKYRSCEDILEAVKPILAKYEAEITLSDEIVNVGNRFYVKASASFTSKEEAVTTVYAYAREPEEKKGMDESQITGTASSYARKYALNGLLLIDDTKDEDTNELREEKKAKKEQAPEAKKEAHTPEAKPEKIDAVTLKAVRARIANAAAKGKRLEESDLCKMFKIEKLEDMTFEIMNKFNALMDKAGV